MSCQSTLPRLPGSRRLPLLLIGAMFIAACSKPPAATPPTPVADVPTTLPTAVEPAPVAAPGPERAAEAAPAAPKPAAKRPARKRMPHADVATVNRGETPPAVSEPPPRTGAYPAPLVCSNCGVVTDVRTLKEPGNASGAGAVAGGIAGLIIGNQIGGGNGRTIAKIAGAAGGAYAGNRIEKRVRAATSYEIDVKLDNGNTTTLTQEAAPTVSVGSAVRVVDGGVTPR